MTLSRFLVSCMALAVCFAVLGAPQPALSRDVLDAVVPNPPFPNRKTPRYNRADRIARYYAAQRPWHGPYSYTQWGSPVALVVPPTASMHTSWSWGVAQSEMQPIYHQFHRDYPGVIGGGGTGYGSLPTPHWPSHTDQFGVYPVRGPW